ncbi:putative Slei family protein, partial [Globisporangium splendens]
MDDPLLLVQRTLIMLLNGHLKSAFKLLHQLSHDLNLTKKRRQEGNTRESLPHGYEWRLIVDMFGNAGLNSFSLLPLTLEREYSRLTNTSQSPSTDPESVEPGNNNNGDELNVYEGDDDDGDADAVVAAAKEGEQLAAAIVKHAEQENSGARPHLLEMNRRHHASLSPAKASSAAARQSTDPKQSEEHLLNCVLIGNLYCQLALDQMKVSAIVSQKNAAFTPLIMEQLKTTHLNMGFITKATEYYDEALKISPEHFLAYYFRSRMLALSAQPKKAAECLSDCLRRHPMFLPALFLRGCIYAQESLTILALADFYRVRHRAPSYPNLHTSIGFCHFDSGNLSKAVEALTEAVQQNPDDVDALYMRGCALQELFVLENAVKDFTHVLTIQPEHFRALYQRSVCRTLFQNYRDALDDLTQVIKLQPEWKEAWNLYAYASFCCDHYEDAIISYGKVIGLKNAITSSGDNGSSGLTTSQQDSQLFLHRSLVNMYANHLQTALMDVDLALKRDHENYVGFVAKAFLLMKLGEADMAMQVLLHALPHYKRMRLMSPCDMLDSERDKMLQKTRDAQRSMSFVANSFTTNGSSDFPAASSTPSSSSSPKKAAASSKDSAAKITASAEVVFSFRKVAREEQEQHAQIYRQRRFTTAAKALETSEPPPSSFPCFGSPSRRLPTGVAPGASSPRKMTLTPDAKIEGSDANLDQLASVSLVKRRARNAKFLRAIKKLTFEYRVLKALENVTSAKYKKNEQRARVLSDLLEPKARVSWLKGTLTSNILVGAFNVLGTFHLRSRKVDDALMAFSLAIQAYPFNAITHFNRGNAFLYNDVLASAVSGFQDAIEVEETCFQAYNNMGVALFHQKRLDDAHDAFASGLHHVDEDQKQKVVLLYNLGVVFQHLDKQDEAMEFYQQAIALDGSRTEFFNNWSSILHQQLRFPVALEDYNRAFALEGDNVPENAENADWLSSARGNKRIEARLNRVQLFITMGNCTATMQDLHVVLNNLEIPSEIGPKRSIQAETLVASPPSTNASSITAADKELAEKLLAFCFKWKAVVRIAVHDFLFGLDTFPCFHVFELFSFFGQQLTEHEEDDMDQRLAPLPIADASYFDYERDFGHWVCHDGEQEPHDPDENDDERDGNTALDRPDEYVLITWRVQVLMQMETKDESSSASEADALRAIALLDDFLSARQCADEETQAHDDDPMSAFLSAREPMRLPARS